MLKTGEMLKMLKFVFEKMLNNHKKGPNGEGSGIYIYIYGNELLFGPSLAFSGVILWSKFVF